MDALESPVLPLFIPPLPARGRPAIRPIGRCRAFVLWAAGGGRPGRTSRTLQEGVVPRSVRSVSGGLRGTTSGSMPGTRRSASTAPGVRHVAPGEAHSSFLRTRCRMSQAAATRPRMPMRARVPIPASRGGCESGSSPPVRRYWNDLLNTGTTS